MRDRLKAIREAAAPLAEISNKRKAVPGLVASLRSLRSDDALQAPAGKFAVVAITRHGITLAKKVVAALPGAQLHVPEKFGAEAGLAVPGTVQTYAGKTGDQLGRLFAEVDGIVAIFSLGALVRLIAPHLKSKETDPAIVVLDEEGKFVIPMLSGHLGGANALSGYLAKSLGAMPVLTTASDVRETIAVDLLGRELGWALEATHEALVHASAAVVNDELVALVQETGDKNWWANHANGRKGAMPANVTQFERLEDVDPARFAAVLWISQRSMPADYADKIAGRCVIYRPQEGQ
jgi:cobalt-precorrin 5A hydrolase